MSTSHVLLDNEDISASHQAQARYSVTFPGSQTLTILEGSTEGWTPLCVVKAKIGNPVTPEVLETVGIFQRLGNDDPVSLIVGTSGDVEPVGQGGLLPFAP